MVRAKAKVFLTKSAGLLTTIFSYSESSFAFLICLLAIVFVYRIQLTVGLFTRVVRPFDFNPTQYPVWFTLAYLPGDLAFVFLCFSLCWLISRMASFIKESQMFPILRISGLLSLHLALMILLLLHGIHGRLFFDVQAGFDTSVMKEAFSGISLIETLRLVSSYEN